MSNVKEEILICHGCLSAGRNLQQLKLNTDLYYTLLANGKTFMEVLLCWECIALLQRVKCFQKRIQRAQQYLEKHSYNLENLLSSDIKSLSSLNTVNNCKMDSTDCKTEEEKEVDEDIKVEPEIAKVEKVCLEVDTKIKEETYEDLSSIIEDLNGTDMYNDYDDITEDTYDNVKDVKDDLLVIRKFKHKSENKKIVYKSLLNRSNIEIYIKKVIWTPSTLRNLKKAKTKSYKKKQTLAMYNKNYKKLSDMKTKDISKLAESETSTCSLCNGEITLETINSHYEQHKLEVYLCGFCQKTYFNIEDISNHILHQHRFVYECPKCSQRYIRIRDLRKHLNNDHIHICDYCNKQFRTKKKIIHHMRLLHLPAVCRICGASFRCGERLQNHQRRIHVPRAAVPSYCVECDKHYPHANAYKAHLRSSVVHVPRRVSRIPCPECGRVFSKGTYMRNHYKLIHLKQTRHYCNICDKYFANGFGLRVHIRYVHEKAEKPRNKVCDICGRAFHNQKILTNHIRTHTGERPHQCPHCPAAFAQRTAMVSHIRTQHKYL